MPDAVPGFIANMIDPSILLLHVAAFVASFFQAVTGIGFGMIAGPFILMVLEDPAAVVISTLMSALVAYVLFPLVRHGTNWRLAGRLLVGAVIGLPIGVGLLALADIQTLKLGAGLAIAILTALMLFGAPGTDKPGWTGDLVFGGLGGIFGGALAMPGPTAALRAAALGHKKAEVRASMMGFFVGVWPMILAAQWIALDIKTQTFWNAASLMPATLAGLVVGNYAASKVSESFFRRVVIVLLIATSASLIGNVIWVWMGDAP